LPLPVSEAAAAAARIMAPMSSRRPAGETVLLGLALAAVLPLTGCTLAGAAEGQPKLRLTPVELNPHRPERKEIGQLRFEAGFHLRLADRRFGGFSGLWLDADGMRMIAASDGGMLWQGSLEQDVHGRLVGIGILGAVQPATMAGDPRFHLDQNIEALAYDGTSDELILAYEGTHRLRRVPLGHLGAPPGGLPLPPVLLERHNSGIEALTALPDGRFLALLEERPEGGGGNAWIIDETGAVALDYVPEVGFKPTGADRLDDEIYVLERRFSWIGGFQSRIVRLPARAVRAGARLEGEELGVLRPPFTTDNFEAIAARRAPDGGVLLTMLSDDNFNLLQRTLLLQFRVAP
jgi:hypothetical protein